MAVMKLITPRRGRPRKFGRPARAITLTLPEDVIDALAKVDEDLSRAVVRISQPLLADVVPYLPAELSKYGDSAVIVVKPLPALARISGVSLVPLPDGRALISLDDSMGVPEFELTLRDAIDEGSDLPPRERTPLKAIAEILRSTRKARGTAVNERRIIVLRSTRHR
jgi:hypothetical protein